MSNTTDAKRTMYLHSEAKVTFYKRYLERYLRILTLAPTIQQINIFDVFCGTGIYDNGKKGSPIVAIDVINALGDERDIRTNIRLDVNDGKSESVDKVKQYVSSNNKGYCVIAFHNKPAEEMFAEICVYLRNQGKGARNLLFIDPYGYKDIRKETLQELLNNSRTEIILFLPISQMQRFTSHALLSDEKAYEPLKNFVYSFFPEDHPVRAKTIPALQYIDQIKHALRFGRYHSTSYYIERDSSNYYALFFMTSHIYGFEKILDVKWQLDNEDGRGFRQPESSSVMPLFIEQEKELARYENFSKLERILERSLESPKNNLQIYEIILANEFLPTHCAEVFRNWQQSRPNFSVRDVVTDEPVPKGRFYVNWDSYNPAKNDKPKVVFSLSE